MLPAADHARGGAEPGVRVVQERLEGAEGAAGGSSLLYHSLVARYEAGGAHGTQIRKDIGRTGTLPGERTCINTPEGLRVLERILGAFSEFDGWYGYCQSMNMVAAQLLVVMTLEEEE